MSKQKFSEWFKEIQVNVLNIVYFNGKPLSLQSILTVKVSVH